MNMPVKVL